MAININEFIQVSIVKAATQLGERKVNIIALFTKEEAKEPIDNYVVFKNSTDAANMFGLESMTYKMVNSIYSQTPNILIGGGYVLVFPMLKNITEPASSGYIKCSNLIAANFKDISDGSLKINVDDAGEQEKTDLDFTNTKTLQDVVDVLKAKITECNIVLENNNISFISKTTGATSKVVITKSDTGTDITTTNLLNIGNSQKVDGKAEYTGSERLQDVILRTNNIYYGACMPCYDASDDEINEASALVNTLLTMLVVVKDNTSYLADNGVFDKIRQQGYNKTRCLYYGGETKPLLYAAAYTSSYLAVNYSASNSVKNLNAKELKGILPDNTIGATQLNMARKVGVDVYCLLDNIGAMFCSGANEYFDTVAGLIWLQIQIENAGFSALRNIPTKIPQTEAGIDIVYNAFNTVLKQAVNNGFVAAGEWTLPVEFKDIETLKDNVRNNGYYIYFEPLSEQSQSDRDARIMVHCSIYIKLAGAVNKINVVINVNN